MDITIRKGRYGLFVDSDDLGTPQAREKVILYAESTLEGVTPFQDEVNVPLNVVDVNGVKHRLFHGVDYRLIEIDRLEDGHWVTAHSVTVKETNGVWFLIVGKDWNPF